MTRRQHKRLLKRKQRQQSKRWGLKYLLSLLDSGIHLVVLLLFPLVVLFVSAPMYEAQIQNNEPTYLIPINPPEDAGVANAAPAVEEGNDLKTISDVVDELAAAQEGQIHPFDLGSQVAQAQAVKLPTDRVTDFGFTDHRLEEFGLLDYGGRYYNPTTGQFISPDPLVPNPGNPQALNRYGYAYNNPVRYTDPTGHCIPAECPWSLSQTMYDQHGASPGGTWDRYRKGAKVVAALNAYDPTMSSLNMTPTELIGPKMGILNEMHQFETKEGLQADNPAVWNEVLQAGAEAGVFFMGGASSSDNYAPPSRVWAKTTTPWQRTAYQRNDIDWDLVRPSGVEGAGSTNWEAAQRGYAPGRINPSTGKWNKVHLHHGNEKPKRCSVRGVARDTRTCST